MGKVKNLSNNFTDNYHGVLNHDGSIKVAKTDVSPQQILNIAYDKTGNVSSVLVKGNKGSYTTKIHKNMRDYMDFVEEGDYAFVKWKMGEAWFIGFIKQKSHDNPQEEYIDEDNNCDWDNFMRGVDVE